MTSAPRTSKSLQSAVRAVLAAAGLVTGLLGTIGTAASARDIVWGVNGHPFTAYPGVSYTSQLDLIRELGARSYRVNVSSTDHIERLRDLVALGARRGIDILPVLTPPLDLKTTPTAALYANSFNFAFAIASAVRRHVRTIELGNELENHAIIKPCERQTDGRIYSCNYGLGTGIATTDYEGERWKAVSAVLKGLSDGTTAADPTMKKAVGSAGWGHTGMFALMERDGIRWDISVWHAYQQDPHDMLQKVAAFRRPIWITEFNFPPKLEGDPVEHAKGLQGMIDALRPQIARFNIEAVHIYELLDEPYWGNDTEAIMGLATLKRSESGKGWEIGDRKPSFEIVKTAISGKLPVVFRDCNIDDLRGADRMSSMRGRIEFSYCLVLGRLPEGEASENWSKALSAGKSMADLILTLCETDEFQNKYDSTTLGYREFVHLAFELLLGRRPDGGGMQAYLTGLGNGSISRVDVLRGIVSSSEFANRHQTTPVPVAETR